ncbi:MAG: hypothetical protein ABI647_05700 [Gemmatimonadota bacterium]
MTRTLVTRRRSEIDTKLASLDREFEHWKAVTEQPDRGLRRHHSQVRRLTATIDGLLDDLRKTLAGLPKDSPTVLKDGESWENEILAAHSIWEVFRSKLVLREDDLFRTALAACDDLAWECYAPALKRFDPERKGPPLVFLTATWSPFALARDSNFQNEIRVRRGPAGALAEQPFQEVLGRLPVPLVGVPWYQAVQLPSALIIAHETGHVVEFDFRLTADITEALEAAGLDHPDVWKEWASEVFADIYGCLAMGPAFAGTMSDLLTTAQEVVQKEERRFGAYPTRALRVELMVKTLELTGHGEGSKRVRSDWESIYGAMQTMLEFQSDVERVVKALLAGPYSGRVATGSETRLLEQGVALTTIISFPVDQDVTIKTIAETAALKQSLTGYDDPRLLFAAAQWLHANPEGGESPEAYAALTKQIVQKGANQFRSRGAVVGEKTDLENDLRPQEAKDRKAGSELRDFLRTVSEVKPASEGPQP